MNGSPENEDKLEEAERALYAKNAGDIFAKRRHGVDAVPVPKNAPSAWTPEPEQRRVNIPYAKIFIGALVFFIIAVLIALYTLFGGSGTVSGNNINILISGPVSVSGGEAFPLDIKIVNGNATALENVSMLVEYPAGTRDPANPSAALPRQTADVGTIAAGKSADEIVKASLYGQENVPQTIAVTVSYSIAGSNAVFTKEKDYMLTIGSSPVALSVAGDTSVNARQAATYTVTVASNSLSTVSNLILKVDYPFGFTFSSSDPQAASLDGSVFSIGDLAPGTTKTITIRGSIDGQDGDERVLKFTVGTPASDGTTIDTPYSIYTVDVAIRKPSVGAIFSVNKVSGSSLSMNAGDTESASIDWQNNLTQAIDQMNVQVALSGTVLDPQAITTQNGFYNSADNSITFSGATDGDLSSVAPGGSGSLAFTFGTLSPDANPTLPFAGSEIRADVTVTGIPAGGSNTVETLYSGETIIKVSSALHLLSRAFHSAGPFENSGPVPPKVNSQTTYTVTLTATNSFNAVTNAVATTTLPAGVVWTGFTSPASESLSYDQSSGAVIWNIGNLSPNTGVKIQPRSVSFQVAVTPSLSQVGSAITLLGPVTLSGTDAFSGATLSDTEPAVTTEITSDPAYVQGIGTVGQ
ncbi:MAG: hypothetical protein KGH93_01255 [Patescibacteria group bacterium]|nr:hypothetical protein [Patescibacteria group bacterium]MDE1945809.1 hypothetical protein [Patescibacteria group bacterium]